MNTTDNRYLDIFIHAFVNAFRKYINDPYTIVVKGLGKFATTQETTFVQRLGELDFDVQLSIDKNDNGQIEVYFKNDVTKETDTFAFVPTDIISLLELSSRTQLSLETILIMKIVSRIICFQKILYKAIVLDMDETLILGTLSEDGIDVVKQNMCSKQSAPFISFMRFVKILGEELGIFVAICSRNDAKLVEAAIDAFDEDIFPLKGQIDCIIANNNDKSANLLAVAKKLSILPEAIVFIDDNKIERDKVREQIPNIFIPEWDNHHDLVTQLIAGCIFDRPSLSENDKKRKKHFQIMETARTQNNLSDFFITINEDKNHVNARSLYAKSNQFKFSSYRNFESNAKSLIFEIYRKNGDNIGICSTLTYTITEDAIIVHNWAISCKYFEIGLEEFILLYLISMANSKDIIFTYEKTSKNQKTQEMLKKYSYIFTEVENGTIVLRDIGNNEEVLKKNTNLKIK